MPVPILLSKKKNFSKNCYPSFHKCIFQMNSINLNLLKILYIFIQSFSLFLVKINEHPSGILKEEKHQLGWIVIDRKFRIYEYIGGVINIKISILHLYFPSNKLQVFHT